MSPWIVVARSISSVVWRQLLRVSPLLLAGLLLGTVAFAQDAGTGALRGRVIDAAVGTPLEGVDVTLVSPGGETSRTTDAQGGFEFTSVPAAEYEVRFRKSGYRDSSLERVAVRAGAESRADMSLPAAPTGAAPAEPVDIEEFVVVASPLAEILAASRMSSDELINTLNAEEFAKFAASDVADALKFVPGVNVVEGQFAIIRGLEDRYSSTLYNFAPMPSPDPDSQSVQLDLFPADIVGNLVVSKTFAQELPSNSSGGAINVLTHEYPDEEFQLKISTGTGLNGYAWDQFLRFDEGSPVGVDRDGWKMLESDMGGSIGGRRDLLGRELRFKGVFNREIDFETAEGFQEGREPSATQYFRNRPEEPITKSGDLSLGDLSLSDGRYELTESERSKQLTGYGGLGLDLDEEGNHKIDGSVFYTNKQNETVESKQNGYFPNLDYDLLLEAERRGDTVSRRNFEGFGTTNTWLRPGSDPRTEDEDATRGPLWYTNYQESRSFDTERDLFAYQINGDHDFDAFEPLEGLHLSWALNRAKTTQQESVRGAEIFYEPDDLTKLPKRFPAKPADLGAGRYATGSGLVYSENDIEEIQKFGRVDTDYTIDLLEDLTLEVSGGAWYERSKRDVRSTFLQGGTINGSTQFALLDEDVENLGERIFEELDLDEKGLPAPQRESVNDSLRKIEAWHVGAKATLFERIDLFGGFRREDILITSNNDPFTGELVFGGPAPAIYPSAYLFFDRLDNRDRGEVPRPVDPSTVWNDQIVGVRVPVDPSTGLVDLLDRDSIQALVNGRIDEDRYLPSLGVTIRPIEGLNVRGAFSRTVARPSFREMGYYVSVEPGSDDLVIGNPQLQLSDVTSFDVRVEYGWGEHGDLVALSAFRKRIAKPIESLVLRDPTNAEVASSSLFRTFFNNPDTASLRGVEVEARKSFDFLDFLGVDALQYLSVGGNFTYIDASVERTQAELARSLFFFGTVDGEEAAFSDMDKKRRLYNQPEWIANADVSFDHPDWGTQVTLAFFMISDVLDAAGSAFILPSNGRALSYTLDRYVDSYYQLDLVASQRIWRDLTLKVSVKNLTNSVREIIYDPNQTVEKFTERRVQIGRDYSISLSYSIAF